ncbi:MAG: protein-disulfide reductase DsbD family protein [Acidobacteria bacterium]|nr:protein-disulfide reductase DsbD family protein [Acidobacteriota bacterium]
MRVACVPGIVSICMTAAAAAFAQAPPARAVTAAHVTVELLCAAERPVAGQQAMGLQFTLEPGWHIYWQNPGDSGTPPDTQWQLPAGVWASPVEWPLPERIDEAGSVNYGYRGHVVLPFTLTIAPSAAGAPLAVRAAVQWLVCRDMCVAGKAALELKFPLVSADRARVGEWELLIAHAKRQVPQPAPSSWKATAKASGDAFVVDIITGRSEQSGTIFPLDVSQVDDGAPQGQESLPAGVRFTLRKSQQLVKDPATLRLVVALDGGRAGIIEVPLVR